MTSPKRWSTYIFIVFSLNVAHVLSQNIVPGGVYYPSPLTKETGWESSSANVGSPTSQLMNTVLTLAAARGILPEGFAGLRPETLQRLPEEVIQPLNVPTDRPLGSYNLLGTRFGCNNEPTPVIPTQVPSYAGQQIRGINEYSHTPISPSVPSVLESIEAIPYQTSTLTGENGLPINLEINIPSSCLPTPSVNVVNSSPTESDAIPLGTIPPWPVIIIEESKSGLKNLLPIILMAMLANGNDRGCCQCCSEDIFVPYPIPVPTNNPIINMGRSSRKNRFNYDD